ncbi:transglycosylase domain-containing protein [Bifidobacterium longum]|nr:transglycosylase domain-containing protein [Bifidobacterium longum]MDB6602194.1 transglycosylase domain-containing protein [Bifidobacterium longum]MDB6603841.1 transglycosylase domain-containing protein [Bifidobacterium longum]MDB6605798.1 transglycosylase domain-containing protein [Bifidobacterium longum]MDB6607754.1 transglycosylase domain-containing protein [Bifidobacterium longum]
MGPMPKKKSLTLQRVLVLLLAYIMLAVCGGVAASVLFVPGVVGANKAAKAVIPSLKVENVDFDVTSLPQKSTMYARDGSTVIATFYNQNRIVVPLKKISKTMQQAVVAREDRRFWTHAGVDVQGVMRAFVQTYLVKGSQQGGSSLTQQYVKNVLLMQAIEDDDSIAQYHATEDTIARKIREMLISVQMEKKYSKAEILQGYLNIAQFGNNLYGVETAAQRYFSVSAADLNVVQSATIAAITKNPSLYDPLVEENQKESENQRNIVLKLMLQEGYITQKQYTEAVNTPLKDTLKVQDVNVGCQDTGDYAYFCDFVVHRIQNSEEFGKTRAERNKLLQEGGLKIVTTLDVEANSTMMETARNTIPPDDPSGMEIAMAAVKPGTGEVLSFGLNRYYDATPAAANDPTRTSQNYAVDLADGGGSGWTIGSSWKPINLIAWMEAGHSINDNLQTSTSYPTTDFACSNYSGGADSWNVSNAMGAGTVNPESPFLGLVRSHNTTQASMGAILKLCKVADTATELGYHDAATGETIDKTQVYTPSMMIGSVNVSPLTMASIFAVYASNGVQCNPIAISKVTDKDGNDLKVPSANCHQAVDKDIIQTLAYTLNQGTVRPDGAGWSFRLADGRKSFGKTGTSEDLAVSGGSFIPNQIAAFAVVGDAQNPYTNRISNIAINGRYNSYWDGSTIAAPAVTNFFNSYISKKKIPIDNDYGQPVSKYTTTGKYLGIGGRTFSVPQTTTNGNSQSQTTTNGQSQSQSQSQNTGQNNTQTQGTNSERSNDGQ